MNTFNSSIAKAISYVSSNSPCVHCGKPDWCYRFANAASVCNRGSIGLEFEDSGKKDKSGNAILYPEQWNKQPPKPKVISSKEWLYYGRNNQELVKVIRQNLDNGKKNIFQNFKGANGWIKTRPKSLERSDIAIYKRAEIKRAMKENETIFIVEGEKVADLFWQLGLAATTNIQGANNYSDSDLRDFWDTDTNSQYKNIVLVPDRDVPGVKLMKQWEKGLGECQWLYPYFDKDWKNIPESDGLDAYDWITDNGLKIEDIEDAISIIPESFKKVEVKLSTPLQESDGYDESFQSDDKQETIYDSEYPYNVEAVEKIYGNGHYISFEERLYQWNGKFYEKCDPGEEKQKIRFWAEQTPVYDPRTKRDTYKYLGTRYLNEIWNWALITFAIKSDRTNPPGLNLANGVLKVHIKGKSVSWELLPHSPKDYFLYCSEVEFNPDANPDYCDRLLECLDPAPRTAFLRQVGAALDLEAVRITRGRDIRAAICRGSGSNGKDSLHEAIALIFTDNQICSAGFNQFISYDQGRQFTLAKLRGAKINWAPENNKNNSLDGSQSLNQAISGDRGLEYERKGKDADPFIPQCIHFFNVNQLPKITTGLESIMSRFAVYDFNKTFSMNPNPAKGELQADPRFKYDREFITKEVCPALINYVLVELKNLLIEGIDYNAIKHSLDDIQEESTHLWGFCHEVGLSPNPDMGIYITDLWEILRSWYIDNGTLEPLPDGEKGSPNWNDQANPYDRNIRGQNQIYKRFQTLFPKIERIRQTQDSNNKGRWYLQGLQFNNSASLLHFPIKPMVSASPLLHYSFTTASLETGEAKSEAKTELVKQGILTQQGSEAVKQKSTHHALELQENRRDSLLETISFWQSGLGWSIKQVKNFAKAKIGLDSSKDMSEAQLYQLGQLLAKEIPLTAKKQEF